MFKRIVAILIIVLLVLTGVSGYFYYQSLPRSHRVTIGTSKKELTNVVEFKQSNNNCGVTESIKYYHYIDSDWSKNNKFGLYIYAENKDYFKIAQKLVNSNGGDWGYVLIPYNVKDRDLTKWTRVFDQLQDKHLIPIIQLWDVDVRDYKKQTEKAAEFLNRFIWPVKERYISVYNEMNDPRFWYGYVDPKEYAEILDFTIDTFKSENMNFFMMNGAFNVTAPSDGVHLDAFSYMYQMNQHIPGIFNKLDGWASHPYPQPNFSGNPYTLGRTGIRAYEAELEYLYNSLGVDHELPVFITETGWAHAEGLNYDSSFPPVDKVAENFRIAFEEIWLKDDRVRAVTPFTIRYNPPFDHFSWINADKVPYKHYDVVKEMKKVSGNPPHIEFTEVRISSCDKN